MREKSAVQIMCLLTSATAFKTAQPTNIARFDTFASARDVHEEETAPPPPPGTLRAEVAKGVKRFLLQ